jgi:hypothetical protein
MKIEIEGKFIKLKAQNAEETRILGQLFGGLHGMRYRMSSFGYGDKLPKHVRSWNKYAEKQQLTFTLDIGTDRGYPNPCSISGCQYHKHCDLQCTTDGLLLGGWANTIHRSEGENHG